MLVGALYLAQCGGGSIGWALVVDQLMGMGAQIQACAAPTEFSELEMVGEEVCRTDLQLFMYTVITWAS